MKVYKTTLQILLPILFVFAGYLTFQKMKASKEPPRSKPRVVVVPEAEVVTISPKSYAPPMQSFGIVESYDTTSLISQVQAPVIEISPFFRTGLQVSKGDVLVKIDPAEFLANVETARANIVIAESSLSEEKVTAQQAKDDWVASGRKLESASDFVLRKPQLASAEASVQSARADLALAMKDLENTRIRAPYDGVISSRNISIGNLATISTILGTILSTEKAEVRLPLTPDQLAQWHMVDEQELTFTNPGMPESSWTGVVRRTDPTIDSQNQVSYLIAEIDSPYASEPTLPIGTFLNAEIPTPALENVYKVADTALVNDAFIWQVNDDNTLRKVAVSRHRSYQGFVYFSSIGEFKTPVLRVITRPLTTYKSGEEVTPIEN